VSQTEIFSILPIAPIPNMTKKTMKALKTSPLTLMKFPERFPHHRLRFLPQAQVMSTEYLLLTLTRLVPQTTLHPRLAAPRRLVPKFPLSAQVGSPPVRPAPVSNRLVSQTSTTLTLSSTVSSTSLPPALPTVSHLAALVVGLPMTLDGPMLSRPRPRHRLSSSRARRRRGLPVSEPQPRA
jgi:hypothetical protein